MKPFATVDILELVLWLATIPFETWPQQRLHELRPAMVTDPTWHGFGSVVEPVVSELLKYLPEGVSTFQYMLSVVMPGHDIEAHIDNQAPSWLCRVHVPLMTNDKARFVVCGVPYQMLVGCAYQVDTRKEHAVINPGNTPRVHFMFDVKRG